MAGFGWDPEAPAGFQDADIETLEIREQARHFEEARLAIKETKPMTLLFKRAKETKNTVKFEEVVEEGSWPAIGTLYVQKPIVAQLEIGDLLKVEIAAG